MTDINYPEVAQAGQLAERAHDIALAVKIDCPEMLAIASDELRGIVTRRKEIEDLRFSITRPMDAAKQKVMDLFRAPLDRLGQAESLLRDEVTRYQRAEREKADAERREAEARSLAEQAEAERREQEALEAAKAAQASGDMDGVVAATMAAEAAREDRDLASIAPLPVATRTPAKPTGVGTRVTWKAEVTDLKALVLEAAKRAEAGDEFLLTFLMADEKVIGQAAKAMQAKLNVPGIRTYAEESLSVRRKAS
ncbi:MAG: hypothetical protein GAK28_00586 [Luteibacter sp.]|uniref:hypothetical protein n=1 Tax=Luteibacter sp. TaxID=1886636 RepID=UPI00137E21FE|nr:hypothetical protein [Luteibacter sp.]KAF1008954.1 MAG: hypothetical protein GAK28_00586 [Luteibacter sp.]